MFSSFKRVFRGRNLREEKEKLEEQVILGGKFESFVMDFYPLFNKHVFEPFEKELYDTWVKLSPDNKEAIRNCQSMQIVIDKLRNKINSIIEDGQFAQHQLTNSTPEDWEE